MRKLFLLACFCGFVIPLSSCGVFNSKEVTVSQSDSPSQQREYFRNELVNHDGLALESENFLRGNLMQDNLKDNPQAILNKLNEYRRISGNPKFLIIAADLCRYLATQAKEIDAIRYNLSSFYYCTTFARMQRETATIGKKTISYDFTTTQGFQDYNEACCGIFSFLKKRALLNKDSVALQDIEGHQFVLEKPEYHLSVPPETIEDYSLCASYTVKDLMQVNRQPGVGVPLVARVKLDEHYASLKIPKGLTIPVTMLIKRKNDVAGKVILQPVFIDTNVQETYEMRFDNSCLLSGPLALDFSTPLACFLDSLTERNLLGQMLNAFDQESSDGLYMVEPYQPNKIPVVFIHGLMSSPETWMQMINSLKNDPTIRKRYQFWFFSYSTGASVLHSAMKLHDALLAAQKEFCTTPEATENFNKMVLAGHSMGGLLTRMMVQKNPYYIAETVFDMSIDKIKEKLQPDDLKYLDSFIPYPLPFVHRAVFMAVPHRGAKMAMSPIARFGISIIKLPASVLNKQDTASRIIKTLKPQSFVLWQNRPVTGIDSLNPDNKFVHALGSSEMKDDLVYHCIIGNKNEDGIPGGSDGVVPYGSSHLDGAASELVIKSGHSVHRKPMAIQEMLRILLLHLKETDKKAAQQ